MPKISTESVYVTVHGANKYFGFPVHFNDDNFTVDIPVEFKSEFDTMPEKDQIKYFIRYVRMRGGKSKYAVYGDTKKTVIERFQKFIEYIANKTTVKEPVIVIEREIDIRDGDDCWNTGHDIKISFQYNIGYRVLMGKDRRDDYKYKYYSNGNFEEGHFLENSVNEMNLSDHSNLVIIPDTPENRDKVKSLSDALVKFSEGLRKITEDDKKVLAAIKSNRLLPDIKK